MIVFSPSNLMQWQTCPRKFWGQSIAKLIKYKESAQKNRGMEVHTAIQNAMKYGLDRVTAWPDGLNTYYVQDMVTECRKQMAEGAQLFIEHELVIDRGFRKAPQGWWDENAYLRAKADALILPATSIPPLLVDIKTGKKWDSDDFQLRVEALLVHLIYDKDVVNYAYWYVDQGDTVDGSIDFRNGLGQVQDVVDAMKQMGIDLKLGTFMPRKNRFCKWCDFFETSNCGL